MRLLVYNGVRGTLCDKLDTSNHNNVNKIIFFNSSSRSNMWSVNACAYQCEKHEHNNVDAIKYL